MSGQKKELRRALAEIARIAQGAVDRIGGEHGGHEAGEDRKVGTEYGPDIGCVPRQLPDRLLQRAARTATRINPANGLNVAGMSGMKLGADVMDPQRIAVLTSKYWGPKPRQLTVSFMESTPSDLRTRIVDHLNAWERCGCISFVETRGVGQVRISRGGGGYWSYVGTDILHVPDDEQTMNLQDFTMDFADSEFKRVIRHEAGHTLGFPHEHMRKELVDRIDRQKAYKYFKETQGWTPDVVDAQVLKSLDDRDIMGTPSDQDSIMCYQLPGSITLDGDPIRGGLDINTSDCAFCSRIYPRTGRASEVTRTEPSRRPSVDIPVAASNVGAWDKGKDRDPDPALL